MAKKKAPKTDDAQPNLLEAPHGRKDEKTILVKMSEVDRETFKDIPIDHTIRTLADSIVRLGLLAPPTLSGEPPYKVLDGRRRMAALALNETKQFKATVRQLGGDAPRAAASITLTSNAVRSDNPLAELEAIETLLGRGMDEKGICKQLGWTKGRLYGRLALRQLVPKLKAALADGSLAYSNARDAAKLSVAEQNKVVNAHSEALSAWEENEEKGPRPKVTNGMVKDAKATRPVSTSKLFSTDVNDPVEVRIPKMLSQMEVALHEVIVSDVFPDGSDIRKSIGECMRLLTVTENLVKDGAPF